MARTYKRDSNGRFAGGGGGSSKSGGGKASGGSKPRATGRPAGSKAPPPPPWSAAMKKAAASQKPANKLSASPRRLNAAEQAYWDIKNGKGKSKFGSDAKVRAEMQRRGFLKGKDPHGQLIMIASTARRKRGKSY